MKSAGINPRKRWRAGGKCNPDVNLHKYGSRCGVDVFRPRLDIQQRNHMESDVNYHVSTSELREGSCKIRLTGAELVV